MLSLQYVLDDLMVDSDFQKNRSIISDYSIEPDLHPCITIPTKTFLYLFLGILNLSI